jgi:hypothetical protein
VEPLAGNDTSAQTPLTATLGPLKKPSNLSATFWLFILGSSAVCFAQALPLAMRGDVGGGLGQAIGLALLPFLVAFIARGRKGDWDSFSRWFFYGLLIGGGVTAQQRLRDWRYWGTDQWMKHDVEIMKNAQAGHPNTSDSTPFDDVVRGVYADFAGEAKKYEAARTNLDLADIYTPESFATKDSIRQVLTRVQALAAANRDFYNFWMSEPQAVEKRLSQTSASGSDQKNIMVGFQKSYDESPMGALLKARCDWSASVISLYSFALLHSSEIHVSGQQLVIDPKSFGEFKQKEDASFALQKTVLALRAQVDRRNEDTRNALGLKNQ